MRELPVTFGVAVAVTLRVTLFDPDLLPEMELEALINNDGYIKTMNFSVNLGFSSQNTNVVYSNYGNAQSVTIPDDALNAQEVESLAN